jgi:hypothetical protein
MVCCVHQTKTEAANRAHGLPTRSHSVFSEANIFRCPGRREHMSCHAKRRLVHTDGEPMLELSAKSESRDTVLGHIASRKLLKIQQCPPKAG